MHFFSALEFVEGIQYPRSTVLAVVLFESPTDRIYVCGAYPYVFSYISTGGGGGGGGPGGIPESYDSKKEKAGILPFNVRMLAWIV